MPGPIVSQATNARSETLDSKFHVKPNQGTRREPHPTSKRMTSEYQESQAYSGEPSRGMMRNRTHSGLDLWVNDAPH